MEFHDNMRFMKSLPLEVVGDVLVIAGDVGYLVDTTIPHLRFWKWASENYRQVLMAARSAVKRCCPSITRSRGWV